MVTIDPDDRALLENNLAYQLASKPVEGDASWVRPGKISWEWWHSLNIYGVDFRSGVNTATYKYYIDFAAKYGIDYILLDEGWSVEHAQYQGAAPGDRPRGADPPRPRKGRRRGALDAPGTP